MNKYLMFTLKGVGWIVLAILSLLIPIFIAGLSRDSDEHPLGGKLFLNALFHYPQTTYEIDLSKSNFTQENPIDQIVPGTYTETYDTVSGKRRESVVRVVRYPGHLAVTTQNLLSGEHKYYIIDKSYDTATTTVHQIKDNHIFTTTDSTLFLSRCRNLNPRHSPFHSSCNSQ